MLFSVLQTLASHAALVVKVFVVEPETQMTMTQAMQMKTVVTAAEQVVAIHVDWAHLEALAMAVEAAARDVQEAAAAVEAMAALEAVEAVEEEALVVDVKSSRMSIPMEDAVDDYNQSRKGIDYFKGGCLLPA